MDWKFLLLTLYVDFTETLDKMEHSILLNKSSAHGIAGAMLKWLHICAEEPFNEFPASSKLSTFHKIVTWGPQFNQPTRNSTPFAIRPQEKRINYRSSINNQRSWIDRSMVFFQSNSKQFDYKCFCIHF